MSTYLVSSPYVEKGHLLTLDTLEPKYQLVAVALQKFRPVSDLYASEDYDRSFNIGEIAEEIRQAQTEKTVVYIIVFRSALKTDVRQDKAKRDLLFEADRLSHKEANLHGGLLKYWYGEPHGDTGRNVATCWWRSIEDAKGGGNGPAHKSSVMRTRDWYSYWRVEQFELEIGSDGWELRHL